MHRSLWDAIARVERRHWWFSGRRAIVARALERRLPAGARVLDVGCGTGFVLERLAERFDVTGLEPDASVRARADPAIAGRIHAGGTDDLSALEGRTFDAVTVLDVLEHLDDDAAALRQLAAALAPGGILLVTVPANPRLWSQHDVLNEHRRRYTAEGLRARIEGAGYRVELLTHINRRLYPLALLHRLGRGRSREALALPPAPVNRAMGRIFGGEPLEPASRRPGLSLLAVARRQ